MKTIDNTIIAYIMTLTVELEAVCDKVLPGDKAVPRFSDRNFSDPDRALREIGNEIGQYMRDLAETGSSKDVVLMSIIGSRYLADVYATISVGPTEYFGAVLENDTIDGRSTCSRRIPSKKKQKYGVALPIFF